MGVTLDFPHEPSKAPPMNEGLSFILELQILLGIVSMIAMKVVLLSFVPVD